jgi:hypothetical protein
LRRRNNSPLGRKTSRRRDLKDDRHSWCTRNSRMKKVVLATCGAVILTTVGCAMLGGCDRLFEYRVGFRLYDMSGQSIDVTSLHTNRTTVVSDGKSKLVPHGDGGIIISKHDGTVLSFKNISPMDLSHTPFVRTRNYWIPFGGGTFTAHLALAKNGFLYAVRPASHADDDAKLVKAGQPPGYPLAPSSVGSQTVDGQGPNDDAARDGEN